MRDIREIDNELPDKEYYILNKRFLATRSDEVSD